MKVKNIMCREVTTCRPESAMSEAARIMWERDCGVVPVVDGPEDKLVGVLTDRDICMASLSRNLPLSAIRVAEGMHPNPHVSHVDDELSSAHAAMREHQVRRLPVLDEQDHLVGIVSLNDLAVSAASEAKAKGNNATKQEREVVRTLEAISRHREPASV